MCGRFTLTSEESVLRDEFGLGELPFDFRPRYNIAPTQDVVVLGERRGERRLGTLRWGLVPYWADDPSIGNRLINARAETVRTKPAFRDAFKRRRCLVLADGFYEWTRAGTSRVPVWIRLPGGRPFAFAGLWERWRGAEQPLYTCTIITTSATDQLRPIHDRMPVILPRGSRDRWLEPDADADELEALLRPFRDDVLETRRVATVVNSPHNDGPECIAPV